MWRSSDWISPIPKTEKGNCDHKAATIKAYMLTQPIARHDIVTSAQMCEAVMSSGGVQSVCYPLRVHCKPSNGSRQDRWRERPREYTNI